jgi:chemotaxis protein methyltransferase CheR
MKPADLDMVAALLKERSGLVVSKDKGYLLESRLLPVARRHALRDLDDLVNTIRGERPEPLIRDVVEAMTTNESFFFRDGKPFELFRARVLPYLVKSRAQRRTFRIWCAAASTGQEPYTLAMILQEETAKLADWRCEIIGTDIATEALARARAGLYTQFEVQRGLPVRLMVKYFDKKDDQWQIKPELRAMVQYREYNLLADLNPLGQFDVVFCRNVLAYFDTPTKTRVLDGISRLMPDDSVLFLGAAETAVGLSDRFKPVVGQRGVFCQTTAPAVVASMPEPAKAGT